MTNERDKNFEAAATSGDVSTGLSTVLFQRAERLGELLPGLDEPLTDIAFEMQQLSAEMPKTDGRRQAVYSLHAVDVVESDDTEKIDSLMRSRYEARGTYLPPITDEFRNDYVATLQYPYEDNELGVKANADAIERKFLLTELSRVHLEKLSEAATVTEIIDQLDLLIAVHLQGDKRGSWAVKNRIGVSRIADALKEVMITIPEDDEELVQQHFEDIVDNMVLLADDRAVEPEDRRPFKNFLQSCRATTAVYGTTKQHPVRGLHKAGNEADLGILKYTYDSDGEAVQTLQATIDKRIAADRRPSDADMSRLTSKVLEMMYDTLNMSANEYNMHNAGKLLRHLTASDVSTFKNGLQKPQIPIMAYLQTANKLTRSINTLEPEEEPIDDISEIGVAPLTQLPEAFRRLLLIAFDGSEDAYMSDEVGVNDRLKIIDDLAALYEFYDSRTKRVSSETAKQTGKAALDAVRGKLPNKGRKYWKRWAPGYGALS